MANYNYNPLEIFNQLESQDEYESGKQKLAEAFSASKSKILYLK